MKEGFRIIEELSIPSDFDAVFQVETLIDSVCARMGATENYGNVLIAVTEAVNNAIIHGNAKNKSLKVQVQVGENDGGYCFVVRDEGDGFDSSNLPDPTAPENLERENGRGIFLMRNLSDDVVFDDYGRSVNIYFTK